MIRRAASGDRELTWAKAVLLSLFIIAALLVTLAWWPSYFLYWWSARDTTAQKYIQDVVHAIPGFKHHTDDPYLSTRVRDAIAMGYETTVLAVVLAAAYVRGERKRRRLGQRGADEVKGYLPGK
ncbi:MAG TPA: hypothetical protein VKY26_05065 [Actinomycetota bacterium]|nr:hypothetical protein [Actinomycetota bacterium]